MFTQEEKELLLRLIDGAQVTGNRKTIAATLEKLDALAKKVEEMPVEEAEKEKGK